MASREEFEAELARVATPRQWVAFKARWFADQPWPRRSAEELAAARALPPLAPVGGRTFQRAPLPDDLTPEARHAYFSALARGFAALFPADTPGTGGSAVRHLCPACELFSDDPGPPECPGCGRPFLAMRLAPPPR